MSSVIWTPQPRQAVFMSRSEGEALYGGAAGGGKSDALVCEALRQVHIPHYKGALVRKTYPQLEDLIDKSLRYYPAAFPKARYNSSSHTWKFPSGAKVVFRSMANRSDYLKFQGFSYDFIGVDELTHFTLAEYLYVVLTRNRPNGPGTRVYSRATANPGGIGHGWVKERFISPAPPMTTITDPVSWFDPDGIRHERMQTRIFVPSSVFDNPALLANDPEYVQRLASMPDAEKKALLYGDWDSFSGQVFIEWRNDPTHYDEHINTHVITPFAIPAGWRIWRGFDWGYSKPFSVGWYAADHDGRIYRIREMYGCTGTPDEGVKWEPARVAREIRRIENEDPNLKGRQIFGIADPSIWGEGTGDSVADMMAREQVYFDKADNSRNDGKMQIHHRLALDDEGRSMLYIFSTCTHAIRTIPALVYSITDVEDVDTKTEDHIYDEMRYVCMQNPISPRVRKQKKAKEWSPFDDDDENRYRYYTRL